MVLGGFWVYCSSPQTRVDCFLLETRRVLFDRISKEQLTHVPTPTITTYRSLFWAHCLFVPLYSFFFLWVFGGVHCSLSSSCIHTYTYTLFCSLCWSMLSVAFLAFAHCVHLYTHSLGQLYYIPNVAKISDVTGKRDEDDIGTN